MPQDKLDEPDLVGALLQARARQLFASCSSADKADDEARVAEASLRTYIESLKARADIAADLEREIAQLKGQIQELRDELEDYREEVPDRG